MTARELFILLSLSACSASVGYRSEAPEDVSSRFRRFLDEIQLARLDRDASAPTWAGVGPRKAWPDTAGHAVAVDASLTRAERTRLSDFSPVALDPELRRSHQLLTYELERRLERLRWSEHDYLAVPGTGPLGRLHAWLREAPAWSGAPDAEAWIACVSYAGPWVDDVSEALEARAGRGALAPRLALEGLLAEGRALTAGRPLQPGATGDGLLLRALQERVAALPEATPSTREDLLFRGMTALQEDLGPALERLVVRVEALAARSPGDSGAWSQPEGEAWYAWRLRDVTTLPLTPQALHWLAQGEVARLHLALGEVRDQLDDLDHPTDPTDLADLFQLLRTDPPLPAPEAARPAELEARLRGALAQVVSAPSDDLSATPADDTPRYALLAHLARQGAPGAALREAAVRGNETLPAFRRHLDVPAWSAGWDLYAAGLPRDLGLAEDPLVAAGVLTEELWAVGLLVVDTGLHHERWTLEQARDWLRANTPAEGARLEAALLEVLVRPGAAAAAPIGCLHLRELRTETEGRLGSRFDPVAFHDLVLDLGPVTLGMLEQHVRAWEGAR